MSDFTLSNDKIQSLACILHKAGVYKVQSTRPMYFVLLCVMVFLDGRLVQAAGEMKEIGADFD